MIDVSVSVFGILMCCDESICGLNLGHNYSIVKMKYEDIPIREKICDGGGKLNTDYLGSRLIEPDGIYFMCITKRDTFQIEDIQLSGGVVVLTDETLMRPDELSRYTASEMEYLNAQINLCRVFHAGNIGFRDVYFTYQHNTLGIKNTFNNNSHNQTRNVIDSRKWQLCADEVVDINRWLSDYAGAPYQLLKNGIDEFSWGLEQIDLATGFEKYTTTLEMILLEKNATGKKQKLANRVSVFIGVDNATITALHQKMLNYYRFRSESLHEGDGSNISDVELKELETITRSVVKEALIRCRLANLKDPTASWNSIKKEIINDLVSQIITLKSVGVLPN